MVAVICAGLIAAAALDIPISCTGGPATSAGREGGVMTLENDRISLSLSERSGAITGFDDKARGVQFVDGGSGVPFRLDTGSEPETAFDSFSAQRDTAFAGGSACELRWEIAGGLTLRSRLELREGADEVSFTSRLENRGERSVLAVEYPVVGGLKSLGTGSTLVHPYVTGFLVHDPLRSFSFDGDGLRYMPYPESFSGASMQFFAYYCPGVGGLYFAAEDGSYGQKWLNFYRMAGRLEASLMYGYEDVGRGKGLDAPYRFVLKTFAGDDWYQAADIYKGWAVKQDWCSQGTLLDRGEAGRSDWLLEKVGASTFGIDASHDRTRWLARYHEDIGTPIFHVLGPDWPRVDQNFYNSVPGGMADWFPTRFSRENLDLIRQQGDYVVPFEFDFLVDPAKSDGQTLKANLELFPAKPRSHDAYNFRMLCPATDFTRTFHVERDRRVYEEAGVDGMYYDISANNLIKSCMSAGHGHPVGGGREITAAYKRIYRETKAALSAASGRYMPLGTEMMSEVFLPEIDYYQARAWAQPSSSLETWPFRSLMKSGQAEMVPLFTYVYHEYGAQRLDGWGKLVDETGELFYAVVARTYLWGGLYEINHEYSPMEAIDGVETASAEHYFRFDPQGFAYDAARAAYLARFAALRTGAANRYLAYGVMQRPPELTTPAVTMSWFHYNSNQKAGEYRDRGSIAVPAVLASAWRLGEGEGRSFALLLANVDGKEVQTTVSIDPASYGITGAGWRVRTFGGFAPNADAALLEDEPLASLEGRVTLPLRLPPRDVRMLELYRGK